MALVADVEAIVLRAPSDPNDFDSSAETVVVLIHDEDGVVGIGEADAPAPIVRELVLMDDRHAWSRGLRNVLLGRDPFEIEALHRDLYQATIYHGRRGLGIHALSAVDVAPRPRGQAAGTTRVPAPRRRLPRRRSGPTRRSIPAPGGRTIGELMDEIARGFERALELGFRAIKMEAFFGDLVSDRELVGCIQEAGGWSATTRRCSSTSATAGETGAQRSGR